MDKLVVTRRGDKVCTAVVSDGKVSQLMLEPDTADSLLGNIYTVSYTHLTLPTNSRV